MSAMLASVTTNLVVDSITLATAFIGLVVAIINNVHINRTHNCVHEVKEKLVEHDARSRQLE
jgi:uncharacterized membrane protein YgaE (UPF0421/DUF939 family)